MRNWRKPCIKVPLKKIVEKRINRLRINAEYVIVNFVNHCAYILSRHKLWRVPDKRAPKVYGRKLLISQAKGQSIYMRVLLFGGLIISALIFYFIFLERKEQTNDSNTGIRNN